MASDEQAKIWTDQHGKAWKVPMIRGRLKFRIPCHPALRAFVLWRDNYTCQGCGTHNDLIADHIISRRNGGPHHPDNLQALCQSCNARKANLIDL